MSAINDVDNAKKYVKRFTTVPESFVDELFQFYSTDTEQMDLVISLDSVAKWLKVPKKTLHQTLKRSYIKDVDFVSQRKTNPNRIKNQRGANNYIEIVITPDCFKRICMMSRTKVAEMSRSYFIDVETQFLRYGAQLMEGMKHDLNPKRRKDEFVENIGGYLYIIRASDDTDDLFKAGRSQTLKLRMFSYQTGRAHEVDLLYVLKVHDMKSAERCVKEHLKEFQYRSRREVYQLPIDLIKVIMSKCNAIDGAKKLFLSRQTPKTPKTQQTQQTQQKSSGGGDSRKFFVAFNRELILPR